MTSFEKWATIRSAERKAKDAARKQALKEQGIGYEEYQRLEVDALDELRAMGGEAKVNGYTFRIEETEHFIVPGEGKRFMVERIGVHER